MTTEEERYQEFLERCLHTETAQSGATRIDGVAAQQREATRFRHLADYHALAARDNLEGRAPLMAIREGYYVMLHKANEALALAGFKTRSHECTLLGIRGLFNAPELADSLRRAYNERRNVDYYIDPENPTLQEFAGPGRFVEETVNAFVEHIDRILREEGLR